MQTNENNNHVTKTHKLWENRLSFETRHKFIDYYNEGYAIYKIAKTFQVTAGTVEYHLRVAKVYIPGRQPTKRNVEIQSNQQILLPSRTLAPILISLLPKPKTKIQILLELEDKRTAKMQASFPKCYKEYLAIAKRRHPKLYNGNYASTINTWSVQ